MEELIFTEEAWPQLNSTSYVRMVCANTADWLLDVSDEHCRVLVISSFQSFCHFKANVQLTLLFHGGLTPV